MEDVTCNLSSSLFTVNDPDPQYVWIPLTILLHRSGFIAESLEVSHEVVNLVNAHSYRSDCFQCSCSSEYLDFNMYIEDASLLTHGEESNLVWTLSEV